MHSLSPGFAGLTRDCLDLGHCEVRITEALVQPDKGGLIFEAPKSRAGKRGLSFPAELVPELRNHLDRYAASGPRGLVFVGPRGGKLRRSNFNKIWSRAATAAGAPGAHFHDLRDPGGTLAATTGATTEELMARLGHSSPRAAMICQNSQGLHQTGEKPQVSRPQDRRNSVPPVPMPAP